jgi:hypothetical protein
MPYTGTTFRPTAAAGIGVDDWRIQTGVPAENTTSQCAFGTVATVGWKLIKPGVVNSDAVVTGTSAPTAVQQRGWNILVADMDVPVADQPGVRKIPSGTINFNCVMSGSAADTNTGFGIQVNVFKRLAGGTFAFIISGQTVGLSIGATAADVDVPVVFSSEVTFDVGETLHVEYWFKGRGGGALGTLPQTLTFTLGDPLVGQEVNLILPGVGLTTRYTRSHAVSGSGTATLTKLPRKMVAVIGIGSVAVGRLIGKRTTVTTIGAVAVSKLLPKVFAATGVGQTKTRMDIPEEALDRITVGGPADYSGSSPIKSISGIVRDSTGTPYAGATVKLIRESDGYVAAVTTSGGDGSYSFTRDDLDPNTYLVLAWEDTGTPTQGVSARGLVPV